MIDPSYKELLLLLAKPFDEEFEVGWDVVRMVAGGLMLTGAILTLGGLLISPGPDLVEAFDLIFKFGAGIFIFGFAMYLACAWKAYRMYQERERNKLSNLKKYD